MLHFRQDPLIKMHFESVGGSFTHKYKGEEYTITEDSVDDLSPELIQSICTKLKSIYKPSARKILSASDEGDKPDNKTQGERRAPGFNDVEVKKDLKEDFIKKELTRLMTEEVLVEDKLNYPRVFMKLLSQPHLALEEKKLVPDYKKELYLYVDRSVGYNPKDDGFHHTMIKVASKMKGIKVFSSNMLRFGRDYYWGHLQKTVPKGKRVLVFTQGCGGTENSRPPKKNDYNILFCTHFDKKCNCGCNTIPEHESLKSFNMFYGIDVPEKLKLLSF